MNTGRFHGFGTDSALIEGHLAGPSSAVKEGSHSGEDHLHLQWDQSEGCRYIGMGFLWKDYKGKDLTGIYEEGAIELMVRMRALHQGAHVLQPGGLRWQAVRDQDEPA